MKPTPDDLPDLEPCPACGKGDLIGEYADHPWYLLMECTACGYRETHSEYGREVTHEGAKTNDLSHSL